LPALGGWNKKKWKGLFYCCCYYVGGVLCAESIIVMRSLPVTHTHNIYVHGCISGPEIFILFHHEFSARLPQRASNLFWGNYAVERWLFEICVSHHVTRRLGFALLATAFGGAGNYSRLAVCCRRRRSRNWFPVTQSDTTLGCARLELQKGAQKWKYILHFYNGEEKKRLCVWMYEQEGRLDDTTRELMLQGFR
jgi:hypothetical protein